MCQAPVLPVQRASLPCLETTPSVLLPSCRLCPPARVTVFSGLWPTGSLSSPTVPPPLSRSRTYLSRVKVGSQDPRVWGAGGLRRESCVSVLHKWSPTHGPSRAWLSGSSRAECTRDRGGTRWRSSTVLGPRTEQGCGRAEPWAGVSSHGPALWSRPAWTCAQSILALSH